jgi:hypothetical protein
VIASKTERAGERCIKSTKDIISVGEKAIKRRNRGEISAIKNAP